MINNNLKITFRNLSKYRLYTLINIAGLAIGIASFILIGLYILDELSFDKYHKNARNIYRLVNVYDFEGVGEVSASSPFPVAWTMKGEYPGMIRNVTRVFNRQAPRTLIEYNEHSFNERRFFMADSTYFEIFDHKFLQGNSLEALSEMNSVVISESTAKKYFGDENAMGKTIRFEKALDLKITGVIEDVPNNSHFKFDFMASLSTARQFYGGGLPKTWVWNPCWTYLLLEDGSNTKLEEEFDSFIQKFFYDAQKDNVSLYLQPLLDIHLKSKLDYEIEPNSNASYIRILASIAIFLLIIAIINYLNLATATSAERVTEIGVKKVFGAFRSQLMVQFLFESVLMAFFALFVSLVIIEIVLPTLNVFSGKAIRLTVLLQPEYALITFLIVFTTGLLAGIYPAIYLSSFSPMAMLGSKLREGTRSGIARKILVIIQFTISIVLIIITISIFNQVTYLKNTDTGFDKDNIVLLPVSNTNIAKHYEGFKEELLLNPNILNVTAVDDILGVAHNTHEFRPEGLDNDKWHFYPALVVQYDFLETFGIELVAGRDFNERMKTDPEKGMLINEAMVKHQGWKSNEDALGKKFKSLNGEERIIGVFKNFNATSLHESAGPFVLNMKEKKFAILFFLKYVAVKINPQNKLETLAFIENQWNEIENGRPFEYSYLNDELAQLYQDEEVLGDLSLILTSIIILIAILGLYGLAAFMTEQRTKEIGIRKVYGADEASLIKLLSLEFAKLVGIAIVIGWSLSWLLVDEWLDYFAYQVNIGFFNFIIGGLIAFVIAMLITSSRAYIASRANPVDILKYK